MPSPEQLSPKALWAYAYLIVPPYPSHRLSSIRAIVAHATVAAHDAGRTWTGRLVLERRITQLLIVSDSPKQDREVDQRLIAELTRLKAKFTITRPMALSGDIAPAVGALADASIGVARTPSPNGSGERIGH